MLIDEDLITYSREIPSEAEYDRMRAVEIAESVKDTLDDLTSEIQLSIEYTPSKALSSVLSKINECIGTLDDFVSGAAE